jgi:hypothetical protein
MSRSVRITVSAAFALAMLSGLVVLLLWILFPPSAGAAGGVGNTGYLRRYAANFTAYGTSATGPELVTNLAPAPNAQGGMIIYNKNFFVADDINTLYVGISATGDTHGGARLQLACLIDGVACNGGPNPVGGSPTGWITMNRHDNYNDNYIGPGYAGDGGGGAGDVHDNTVMKQWCTPFETKAGTHNVQIKMASSGVPGDPGSTGNLVFMEGVDFWIDGARVADDDDRCSNNVLDPTVAVEASTTTAPDGTIIDTSVFAPLTGATSVDIDGALSADHHEK